MDEFRGSIRVANVKQTCLKVNRYEDMDILRLLTELLTVNEFIP
jgi:hypothetical protein